MLWIGRWGNNYIGEQFILQCFVDDSISILEACTDNVRRAVLNEDSKQMGLEGDPQDPQGPNVQTFG